ncbi:MAG: hypothetical protein KDC00_02435 [Flavobacteriales bacterium]|nr:hypothetical protein [Flavobacteriales bacterium]
MTVRCLAVVLATITFASFTNAQSTWTEIPQERVSGLSGERRITPIKARIIELDVPAMRSRLANAPVGRLTDLSTGGINIELPTPQGGKAAFRIMEVPVMHPDLQARFPEIRTYTGVGVDDPGATVKMDLTPDGFHAMVLPGDRDAWYIDPLVVGNNSYHQVYTKRDFRKVGAVQMSCAYDEVNDIEREQERTLGWIAQMGLERVGDCQLRTYRLALSCTGEYAAFHGGTVGGVMSAMVTTMNRVNGMFERDATLTMEMVANNDDLIFLNAGSDPFTNGSGGAMLGENQTTCDNIIGSANYDIGHVFSTGGGGVAYLNSPCNNSSKAGGVTGQSSPVGDPFDIDYVAHEMGHQYGGNHTQNNNCNRAGSAAVEVGSGITIMGYAGICAPNVGNNSIAMFGGYSMQEIAANVTAGTSSTCPTTESLSPQVAPTADAGPNRTIPRSTPFILTGSGADANGSNVLSYSWEQMDNAVATMPPTATNTGGPAWEPLLPKSTPVRYMPNLNAVIANTTPTWEVLSSVARTYNFRLTVRDNVADGGCNGQDNMVVTVNAASGPFLVTQPNTAVSWAGLSAQTVTWDVANTTASPVSCANVDILLSTDGGLTYPTTIITGTPNDGSQTITVPNQATTTARIMVRANGNIFYDISNTNFTITAPSVPDYTLEVTNNTATACRPNNTSYTIQVGSLAGYNSPVTLSLSGLPAGLNASFNPNPVTPAGTSTLTISNTGSGSIGTFPMTLNATSAAGPKNLALSLVISQTPAQTTLVSPADGATGVSGGSALTWNAVPEATSYDIQIATDAAMNNIVESGSGITGTSYQTALATQPTTTYFWFVQAVNSCGFGAPSAIRSYTTADCQNVTVKITMDRYGAESTWSIRDAANNVYASGGPYTTVGTNGEYPQPDINVCLPAGCYDLIVNDSANDGLCCAYGTGYIAVVDGEIPLAFASTFTSSVTVNFCVPATCVSSLPYTEDFESGIGQWRQGYADDIDWTRISGGTPSNNTGPSADHTTGSGQYIYTEASDPNFPNKVAELYGPCVDLNGFTSAELKFWYHMFGANMGNLTVDVWNGSVWTNSIFTLTGAQGDSWQQATVDLGAYVGGTARIRFRGTTGSGFASDMAIDDIEIDGATVAEAQLSVKVWLEGPYEAGSMRDDLRANGLVPLGEPYTVMGFAQVGGGGETTTTPVLNVSGSNAIVDWVLVELRSTADPSIILATRCGLLQRDGDVVDVDGTSPLSFPVTSGNYHVAVRHRNHLGCMTANAVALGAATTVVDFRVAGTATFGTQARTVISGVYALWAGNSVLDDELKYTGSLNDRDAILFRIGGSVATAIVNGYYPEDANMDGEVKYTGASSDRDIILVNIGGTVPTNIRYEQLP